MTKHKNSFVSSTWKKFVDWLFVVVTVIAGVIYAGFSTYVNNAIYHGNVSTATQRQNYYNTLKIISRVLIALIVLFAINIIVSLIALKVAQKRAKIADKVITRLLLISLPFVIIDAIEGPAAEIWMSTQTNYDTTLFSLILVIVEGTCRTMIFIGILFTMKLISAPQAAHYGEYSAVSTGGQQPLLYHQQHPSYPAPTPTPKYEGWTPTPSMYQQPPQGYPYQVPYGQAPAGAPWKQ
ncbi:hypothetical protein FRC17_009565 [Serendipita sp. 399]|nr:hypothetical protein FRC17_009565 [Serendipita sp. 399]